MTETKVRELKKDDLEQFVNIFVESFMKEKPNEEIIGRIYHRLQLVSENKITSFYVAEFMNQIVGIGGLTNHNGSSFIGYIGVLPEYRKRGIGTTIFTLLVEQAKKNNPTQELFSNPGADTIYRRFGYKDDFVAHIYELTKAEKIKDKGDIIIYEKVPDWIYDLDKRAMGFDRGKFIGHLFELPGSKLFGIENEGFALDTTSMFGPIIAKNEHIAYRLINFNLISGNKKIITSKSNGEKLKKFSPEIRQTCYKMSFGKSLENKAEWIWGYNSFASS